MAPRYVICICQLKLMVMWRCDFLSSLLRFQYIGLLSECSDFLIKNNGICHLNVSDISERRLPDVIFIPALEGFVFCIDSGVLMYQVQ